MQQGVEGEFSVGNFDGWINLLSRGVRMSPKGQQVLRVLAGSPAFASEASTAQIAERAEVDPATVVRVAQSLGFKGWTGLQLEIKNHYLEFLDAHELLEMHDGGGQSPAQRALLSDIAALQFLQVNLDLGAVESFSSTLVAARRILLLGSGSYMGPLTQFAHVGSRMGLTVSLAGSGGKSVPASLAELAEGDVLLVLNLWRTPSEIQAIAQLVDELGITLLLISDTQTAPLATYAEQVLVIPAEGSSHFPSLVAASAMIHALLAMITEKLGPAGIDAIRHHEKVYRRLETIRQKRT